MPTVRIQDVSDDTLAAAMRKFVLAVLIAVVAGAGPAAAAPGSPRAPETPVQVDSLVVDATTTYRLDPDAGVIQVTVEARLTNTAPSRRRGNYIETPYYDAFGVPAIGPVAAASATRGGGSLRTTVEAGAGGDVEFVVVDLSPNLVYGSPQDVTIRYDIPAQPSRSDHATRINGAFASWLAVGTGTDGAIDIVIDVPDRFEVEFGDHFVPDPDESDGRAVYRLEDLEGDGWVFGVSAHDDAALVNRPTKVDDDEFLVQAWPGDEVWADFAVDAVERGVPVLTARTGIELEGEREISIAESATPYLYGYGGWFLPLEDRIEIGDELDLQVMLHELAHIWFNRQLFASRWINEGLAEVVSNDVARSFGEDFEEAEPVDLDAPGAQPLNEWQQPSADEDAEAIEDFGYRSSYSVMSALHDEIGPDGLRTLVSHAHADLLAYVGDPEPEESFAQKDWRYFYDIADRVVGSEELAGLFDDYVLDDAQRADVDERADAIEDYEALAAAGDGWTPPLEVRRRMSSWTFDRALTVIEDSHALLERRDALDERLAPRGIDVPSALEDSYESEGSLSDTSEFFDELDGVADAVIDADAAVDGASPIHRIGLLGSSVSSDRDAALAAFDAGDVDEAVRLAAAAEDAVDGALLAALLRLAGVVLVAGAAILVVRRFRGRRDDRPLYGPPAPVDEALS